MLHNAQDLAGEIRDFATGASGHLRIAANPSSYDAMVAMVKAGFGVGVMPREAMALYASDGLSVIGLSDDWAHRQIRLCVREGDDSLSSAGRLLLAHLKQAAAS